MKSVRIFFLLTLMLFTSCSKEIIPDHEYTSSFLDVMGKYRAEREGYAVYISKSGLLANFQTILANDSFDSNPGRGIYFGRNKFIDQWVWDIKVEEDYSNPTLVRPDFLKRKILGPVCEKITLHPDSACGLIELTGKYSDVITITPHFDLRVLFGDPNTFTSNWDSENNVFYVTSESGLTFAMTSNGEWMPSEEKVRAQYAYPWPPFEHVGSTRVFGRFSFMNPTKPIVGFGVGITKEKAIHLALKAASEIQGTKKLAEKRVLDFLNTRAFYSKDQKFRSVAAWDHWLLENARIFNSKGREKVICRPPLPSFNDPSANGTILPALELAGCETQLAFNLAEHLNPELSMRDPEGFLVGMIGLFESYIYTNNAAALDTQSAENSRGLEYLIDWALKNGTIKYLPDLTRWDIDVANSGLPKDTLRLKLGMDDLLTNTVGTIRSATDRKAKWYQDYINLLSGKMRLPRFALPIHNIVLSPPEEWNNDIALVHQIASEMPACNLALVDRNLRGDSRRKTTRLAEMSLRLWYHINGGLRIHASEDFQNISFAAPLWRSWRHVKLPKKKSNQVAITHYMNPEYASWYSDKEGDSSKIPGGSVRDTEVVAERLKFLYENILGIRSRPGHGILEVSPGGSKEFWEGKATRVNADFGKQNIIIYMDPANGVYRFENLEGKIDIVLNLEDIPVDGFILSGQIRLKAGDVIEVKRRPDNLGRNTLKIDGVELINVVRREI